MPVVPHDGLSFAGLTWTFDILDKKILSGFIGQFQIPCVTLHIDFVFIYWLFSQVKIKVETMEQSGRRL